MTKKDLKRYSIIQDCINGIYTVPQAAKILGLSDRQVQRLKKEVNTNGPAGIIHKGRGKSSNKTTPRRGVILPFFPFGKGAALHADLRNESGENL